MDTELFIGLIGVVISVIFFLVTDRKTIGAKQEKITSIYDDITKTLFRSIIHEEYIPSMEEIDRMISTKCTEKKLKISSLPEPIEFINAIYTRIMQDDVLEGKKKKSLINKVNKYIEKSSNETEEEPEEEIDSGREEKFRLMLMMMSSMMAVVITFFITVNETSLFSRYQIFLLLGTFIAAVISIMTLSFIKRFKEENTISKLTQDRYNTYKSLESNISKLLKPFDSKIKSSFRLKTGFHVQPDFEFKKGNKHYFIEIRSFTSTAPRSSIYQLIKFGKLIKQQGKNNITILVINNKRSISSYKNELLPFWDRIFDEKEFKIFRNKLVHKS